MPKNKRPVPRKPSTTPDQDEEQLVQALADLALEIAEQEDAEPAGLAARRDALLKVVRNALRKKNDELLYGAIDCARYTDIGAYQLLRGVVEEAAATAFVHREGAPTMEIDAFLLPLFVQSTGGLRESETFQDDAAFAELNASLVAAGLESPQAKVVLISHLYDLHEIDSISYSHVNEMAREVAATMNDKKLAATPALARSISGWAGGDQTEGAALELRFLLGYACKGADDPFYQAPDDEQAADAWFEDRLARFRAWSVQVDPLVRRCLAADPDRLQLNFMYQDLFFGAKAEAMREGALLAMLAEVEQTLAAEDLAPAAASAVVGVADAGDELVLRVNLYRGEGGALLAAIDQPYDIGVDIETEVGIVGDALALTGITAVAFASRFERDGTPRDTRPLTRD